MKSWLAIVIAALVLAAGHGARAERPSRADCRDACAEPLSLCPQQRRPVACRRAIIRQCRRKGTDVCIVDTSPVTTSTVPEFPTTTTTTIDPGPTVNDCNRAEAEDHRGESPVIVRFAAFDYAPECLRVSPGATVEFVGDFAAFPLYGGLIGDVDAASPFYPPTKYGFDAKFTMTTPGIYPYFTEILWSVLARMYGAVIVE